MLIASSSRKTSINTESNALFRSQKTPGHVIDQKVYIFSKNKDDNIHKSEMLIGKHQQTQSQMLYLNHKTSIDTESNALFKSQNINIYRVKCFI